MNWTIAAACLPIGPLFLFIPPRNAAVWIHLSFWEALHSAKALMACLVSLWPAYHVDIELQIVNVAPCSRKVEHAVIM